MQEIALARRNGPPKKPDALRRNPEYVRAKTRAWRAANPEKFAESQRKSWATRQDQYHSNPAKYLCRVAKYRAAKAGHEFAITSDDLVIPTHCPITGAPIDILNSNYANGASLDRVDNEKGYVKGNVRIISRKANRLKADATIEELERIIAYMRGEI